MADRQPTEAPQEASGAESKDETYARVLLDHLERDCERYDRSRDWGPIVLWMAEEVRRQAAALRLPRDVARSMRERAATAQAKVLHATA